MIMERDALNILQVVEILKVLKSLLKSLPSFILKIIRNDLPNSELVPFNSSYEYCVWRTNSELAINGGWKCPSEFITKLDILNILLKFPSVFLLINLKTLKILLMDYLNVRSKEPMLLKNDATKIKNLIVLLLNQPFIQEVLLKQMDLIRKRKFFFEIYLSKNY